MGISTHTKRLTSRIANATAGLVTKVKNIYRGANHIKPILRESISGRTHNTKKKYLGLKRSLTAVFRRPLSDVSHLSIVLVIVLALLSGLSTISLGSDGINSDFFHPSQQPANRFVSADEKRILEADLVTTMASVHSDALQKDAEAVTLDLYQKEGNDLGTMETVYNVPMVASAVSETIGGKITKYTVQNGDTLSQIANKFGISTDTVRYANSLEDEDSIKPGVELTILPVSGILYTVKDGDTIASVAEKFSIDEDQLIGQNNLYGEVITSGMQIVLPDAEIPEPPKPEPTTTTNNSVDNSNDSNPGISYVKTSTGPNHFPYGWCTWWVAQKRYVPWSGNAWQWYGNAQAYGRPEGQAPVPGAVMVTWESGYGHVAYVESASGNTFTVSEMNYQGFGIVSTRTISVGDGTPIIGFIY